ncbi:AMP-binding protein [Natranaerofaba carboxydovora]|uniref:AMP-binding protein n=1 Tax=Natranaerofaba carboxydovora TaxID=2742683 RepID=UPI001F138B43|nr:AMP-binding protein [Natranaerofaba carboxydovora]UMZ73564.1 Acetyl-coenzyme A synthetase [Natranaerofaba carboxydovora]
MQTKEELNNWIKSICEKYENYDIKLSDLLCDSHSGKPEKTALYFEDDAGTKQRYTFTELKELSEKFAGVLAEKGIRKNDKVAVLLPKIPELIIAALGIWRLGGVYVPLFTAFGPEAISHRVKNGEAKLIITNKENRPKLDSFSDSINIMVVDSSEGYDSTDFDFWQELNKAEPLKQPNNVRGEDTFILLYTSGTTGLPKGVEIPVKALASFEVYMRLGLDVREEDTFWNMADPGWAYGLYYGVVGPLLIGKGNIFYKAPFDADAILRILRDYRVTNFASAPTAYRALRNSGISEEAKEKLQLRVCSSAGETLNFDLVEWSKNNFGVPIYDQYGQTEVGMVVNNHHHPLLDYGSQPNSMGVPMPGYRVVVLNDSYEEAGAGEEGKMAIDTENSPLFWFKSYFNDPDRTAKSFTDDKRYYITGDVVSRDDNNFFYYSSRVDDIILTAGYRVSPVEVEEALLQHDAVNDVAVVGIPDSLRGEIIKAFVELNPKYNTGEDLAKELSNFVKKNYSAHAYPREVEFVEAIPKTPSGKKQRYLLKQ